MLGCTILLPIQHIACIKIWHACDDVFSGTPWTLAAYSVEGKADKNCLKTKQLMLHNPEVLHALLDHITEAMITYVGYQIDSGAQVRTLQRVAGASGKNACCAGQSMGGKMLAPECHFSWLFAFGVCCNSILVGVSPIQG